MNENNISNRIYIVNVGKIKGDRISFVPLTLSRSTSVINIPNSEHIHASDKYILNVGKIKGDRISLVPLLMKKTYSSILSYLSY